MKILIKNNTKYIEELEAIGYALSTSGHQVMLTAESLFKSDKPDIIITSETNEEIQDYQKKYKVNWCLLFSETPHNILTPPFLVESYETLGRFANLGKYPLELYDKSIESDICFITNGAPQEELEKIVAFCDKTEYNVKICGNVFLPSPHFVGICNPPEIARLAKSSKVAITYNKIIRDSLILNNVCAINFSNESIEYLLNTESRENYVLQNKPLIQTNIQIAQKLNEKFRNLN